MDKIISATINCDRYKIGLHGKVFILRDGEWLLSHNVTTSEVHLNYRLEQEKIKEAELKEERRKQKRSEQ